MPSKTAVVICPGRGSYLKENLGTLKHRSSRVDSFVSQMDQLRSAMGLPTITDLDAAGKYEVNLHTKGEHASTLIQTCGIADFLEVDQDEYEIVAVTGNSMGWYTALGCAGALDPEANFELVQTMGSMMRDGLVGGQVLYPLVDSDTWKLDASKQKHVDEVLAKAAGDSEIEIYRSIHLGGFLVFGANNKGVRFLLKELMPLDQGRFPMKLVNHGAFHTPLMHDISRKGSSLIDSDSFSAPVLPLIDGRGCIWQPYSTDAEQLWRYTLGSQVTEVYDFTLAVSVAIKEFSPSHLILLGPGANLGGTIGQVISSLGWRGITNKEEFRIRQQQDPVLLTAGVSD
ncbi:MAG: acyl carrier protein [Zetaproteobacteria bacterium]|nr:acyl carrier protein [Pseudobdellovibrionaceae bacterium]